MKKEIFSLNPFTHGKIVRGEQFINRVEEIKRISRALRGKCNILITGDRRIGKTSLIKVVLEKLSNKEECFYLNLDPITSLQAFIERYAMLFTKHKSVGEKAGELISRLIRGLRIETKFDDEGAPIFGLSWSLPSSPKSSDLTEVLNIPYMLSKKLKQQWIIVLDEFQNVIQFEKDTNFVAEVRNAVLEHSNINYVFMGSEIATLEKLFSSADEKFFNSVRREPIGLIQRSEFIQYIVKQFAKREVKITESIADAICRWARDIPADIQHFCAIIWDALPLQTKRFTEDDFPQYLRREVVYQGEHYLQLWKALSTESDRTILREIARSGPALLTSEFCYSVGLDKSTISRRFKYLAHGRMGFLLHKRRDGYYFSDPFFEEWVRQET